MAVFGAERSIRSAEGKTETEEEEEGETEKEKNICYNKIKKKEGKKILKAIHTYRRRCPCSGFGTTLAADGCCVSSWWW